MSKDLFLLMQLVGIACGAYLYLRGEQWCVRALGAAGVVFQVGAVAWGIVYGR